MLASIVTGTAYWPYVTLFVALMLLLFDRDVYKRVDYVLLLPFFLIAASLQLLLL